MGAGYDPVPNIARFLAGTPDVLGTVAVDCGTAPLLAAGMPALWAKTRRLVALLPGGPSNCSCLWALGPPARPTPAGGAAIWLSPSRCLQRRPPAHRAGAGRTRLPGARCAAPRPRRPLHRFVDVWDATEHVASVLADRPCTSPCRGTGHLTQATRWVGAVPPSGRPALAGWSRHAPKALRAPTSRRPPTTSAPASTWRRSGPRRRSGPCWPTPVAVLQPDRQGGPRAPAPGALPDLDGEGDRRPPGSGTDGTTLHCYLWVPNALLARAYGHGELGLTYKANLVVAQGPQDGAVTGAASVSTSAT